MFVFSFLLWNLSLRKLGCLVVWTSSELLFPRTILKDTNEICCFNTLSNIQRGKKWFIKELWFNLNFCHCSWQCTSSVFSHLPQLHLTSHISQQTWESFWLQLVNSSKKWDNRFLILQSLLSKNCLTSLSTCLLCWDLYKVMADDVWPYLPTLILVQSQQCL